MTTYHSEAIECEECGHPALFGNVSAEAVKVEMQGAWVERQLVRWHRYCAAHNAGKCETFFLARGSL